MDFEKHFDFIDSLQKNQMKKTLTVAVYKKTLK